MDVKIKRLDSGRQCEFHALSAEAKKIFIDVFAKYQVIIHVPIEYERELTIALLEQGLTVEY